MGGMEYLIGGRCIYFVLLYASGHGVDGGVVN